MYVTPKIILNPFIHRDDALENVGFEFEVLLPVWGRSWPADPVWVLAMTGSFRLFPEYSKPRLRGPDRH
jgi:hypothetical protein